MKQPLAKTDGHEDGTYRPLVVIVGWLGCQPRQLKRYERLYKQLGFSVICHIPTPTMVVLCTLPQHPPTVPQAWPYQQSISVKSLSTMEQLAWKLLADLHSLSRYPMIVFHVFSNGGCFLWEKISRILQLDNDNNPCTTPLPAQDRLQALRQRIMGVVMDSCPGSELHRLPEALQFCSWKDRAHVYVTTHYPFFRQASTQQQISRRVEEYMDRIRSDPWVLPQLFLFSEDDSLAGPANILKEIVAQRQQLIGSSHVQEKSWKTSSHCAHLYHHPESYQKALSSFLDYCTLQSLQTSSRL